MAAENKWPMSFTLLLTVLITAGLIAVEANAQTSRRRGKAVPVASPTPAVSEPMIISRADDFPMGGAEPIQPPKDDPAGKQDDSSGAESIENLRRRLSKLEGNRKNDYDEKQKRLSLNLDILTKSEQRSDSLRKQLFEMIEKESSIKTRIDQIDNDARPDALERSFATVGSLKPEELRAQKKRSLDLEKQNLQALLTEVQKNRANIEQNLLRSDALVERLRTKLEKDIDTALNEDSVDKP
jgi:hypothetical protein